LDWDHSTARLPRHGVAEPKGVGCHWSFVANLLPSFVRHWLGHLFCLFCVRGEMAVRVARSTFAFIPRAPGLWRQHRQLSTFAVQWFGSGCCAHRPKEGRWELIQGNERLVSTIQAVRNGQHLGCECNTVNGFTGWQVWQLPKEPLSSVEVKLIERTCLAARIQDIERSSTQLDEELRQCQGQINRCDADIERLKTRQK
jgi:hypothetical protein